MITFLTCSLIIAALLFAYAVRGIKKNEDRDRIQMRLAAVLHSKNKDQPMSPTEAAELHATRWDGD